jgi:hypothetical protein
MESLGASSVALPDRPVPPGFIQFNGGCPSLAPAIASSDGSHKK